MAKDSSTSTIHNSTAETTAPDGNADARPSSGSRWDAHDGPQHRTQTSESSGQSALDTSEEFREAVRKVIASEEDRIAQKWGSANGAVSRSGSYLPCHNAGYAQATMRGLERILEWHDGNVDSGQEMSEYDQSLLRIAIVFNSDTPVSLQAKPTKGTIEYRDPSADNARAVKAVMEREGNAFSEKDIQLVTSLINGKSKSLQQYRELLNDAMLSPLGERGGPHLVAGEIVEELTALGKFPAVRGTSQLRIYEPTRDDVEERLAKKAGAFSDRRFHSGTLSRDPDFTTQLAENREFFGSLADKYRDGKIDFRTLITLTERYASGESIDGDHGIGTRPRDEVLTRH